MSGKLYIVPTPIGNLKDITFRAIEVLQSATLILAEDTRTSGKLLKHFEITTPLAAYHMHNEHFKVSQFVSEILDGKTIALISDAGTPAISDPGFLLVREALKNNIEVECLPGATAFVPALVQSGLPNNQFMFMGFLPQKKGRQTMLEKIAAMECTVVLYESPHRIAKLITQLFETLGDRPFSYSREISKLHHEVYHGTLAQALEDIKTKTIKGEFVVVIGTNT